MARIGATIVLGGIKGRQKVTMDVDSVLYKELTIKGAYSQARASYIEAFRMLAENKYQLERLHTDEFLLEDAEEAILTLGREINIDRKPVCISLHPDASTMVNF